MAARLSVVIVTWNARDAIERTLRALVRELAAGDELIVADNASSDGTPELVRELAPDAVVIDTGGNLGFPAAVNIGAERAGGDLLVVLNPDAAVGPGFAEAIRRPLEDARGWDAWQALVTMDDGARVNTSGGVVHFSGVSWAGELGETVHPSTARDVGFASGACLAIPLSVWRELGGMDGDYFLYHEDVDISLRVRLRGGRVGIEPAARVDHDYHFHKGDLKWRMLERNRWATIIRTYPGPLLALLAPALLTIELAILAGALAGGWARQKLLAWGDVAKAFPRLLSERRKIQATRSISAGDFAAALTADLSSPQFGAVGTNPFVRTLLRAYWRAVTTVL